MQRVLLPRCLARTHHGHSSLNDVSHPTDSLGGDWAHLSLDMDGGRELGPLPQSLLGWSVMFRISLPPLAKVL